MSGESGEESERVNPVPEGGARRRGVRVAQKLLVEIAEHTFCVPAVVHDTNNPQGEAEQALGGPRRTGL